MLEAHALTVEVRSRRLLDQVSLRLQPGELLAVIGPNGAGKSTLLRALSGELKPNAGEISLNGLRLSHYNREQLARVRAVMPQTDRLNFPFTAAEVVALGRTPHVAHSSAALDARVVHETLGAVDALHLAERDYVTLSGGERQRVQLARALAQLWGSSSDTTGRYLLVDEPTSSLDLAHQHSTLRLLRRLRERGIGVLAILHDLNLAIAYADHVLVLNHGRTVALGSPAKVLTDALLSETYGLPIRVATSKNSAPMILAGLQAA